MASQAVFEENLRALDARCPWLTEPLKAASTEGIERVEGPRGAVVLSESGILLASSYDPEREALKLAEQMSAESADMMVAVGFGLGLHFEPYCESGAKTLVIFEPSIERLRAALELTSIKRCLERFSEVYIAQDEQHLATLIEAHYIPGLCVRVVPHASLLRIDEAGVQRAVERVRRVKEAIDTRIGTSVNQMNAWTQIVANNGRRIAENPSFALLENAFEGKTFVVAAAGPSLDRQLELLEERRDEVVVIAIGQTLKALSAAGIRPHLVHILESRNVAHQLTDAGDSHNQNLVLYPDCHPDIFDVPTKSRFVATPMLSPMGNWIAQVRGDERFVISGGTVAQGAVGLAEYMGASRILLIGQDLAFTDGRTYAKGSAYDFIGFETSEDGKFSFTNQKEKLALLGDKEMSQVRDRSVSAEVIWVDGWNEGERVQTYRAYASFIEQYREIGAYLGAKQIELINCTEGGAYLPGLRHGTFREVLDEGSRERFDPDQRIQLAAETAKRLQLRDFESALVKARRSLDAIGKLAERGGRSATSLKRKLGSNGTDGQELGGLRKLARAERKVRNGLRRIPWIDTLVQPEIYANLATTRRGDRQDPSLEETVEETAFLFEATRRGIKRGHAWFDAFEASFYEESISERPTDERSGFVDEVETTEAASAENGEPKEQRPPKTSSSAPVAPPV